MQDDAIVSIEDSKPPTFSNKNKQKNEDKKQKIYMPCEVTQAGIEPGPPAHNRFVGDRTTSGPRLPSQTPGSYCQPQVYKQS